MSPWIYHRFLSLRLDRGIATCGMTNKERLRTVANGSRPADGATVEGFEAEELERVQRTLYMAIVAEAIPRRLGPDADRGALALDKRVARKIANMYRTLWASMDPNPPDWGSREERLRLARHADQDARRAGATVKWPRWIRTTLEAAETRRGYAAALALAVGRPRWGIRRVRYLTSEIDNLRRIGAEAVASERRRNG